MTIEGEMGSGLPSLTAILALTMDGELAVVDRDRCVGCGVCVLTCDAEALVLMRRPEDEVKPVPQSRADWSVQRSARRSLSPHP